MNKKNTVFYLLFATIILVIAVLLIRQKTSSSVDDNVRKIDEVANTPIADKSSRKDNASTKVSSNKIADSLSNSQKLEQLKTEWFELAPRVRPWNG
jgi:cell division protein FtsL